MGYVLGVDLGTTYTAAAVCRSGVCQVVELGNRAVSIPSVVFLTEDGRVLTGEAANRRAVTAPDRVAREFKRRIGDPTPLLVGGSPYSAEALSAELLRWVIGRVSEVEGSEPDGVAVTHPANWGPYKLDLLRQAFRLADLDDVVTLTEPEAAAIHYSTLERIESGMTVAVFDLGGGTFDTAVLRKSDVGFDFLGQPEGIERLGGVDFDEAVFGFVSRALGGVLGDLDGSDGAVVTAVSRLRRDCVDAKEALSVDTEVTVPVVLPSVQTDVRLTRAEFEGLVRPSLGDSIGALQRAVRGAGLEVGDVDLVLLVGGSSRIPLVGQMVGGELGRPVAIDAHPKHSVALGAALAAASGPGAAHLQAVSIGSDVSAPEPDPQTEPPTAIELDVAGVVHRTDKRVTFGRRADLLLDEDNRYMHRVVGAFEREGETWWLRNLGSAIGLIVFDDAGRRIALPAGADAALTAPIGTVNLMAGPWPYEIRYRIDTPAASDAAPQPEAGDTSTITFLAPLTDRERDFMVTFARNRLGPGPVPGPMASYEEVASLWGVSPKTVENTVAKLKDKLNAAGVRGIDSTSGLVDHLLAHGRLTVADLLAANFDAEKGPTPSAQRRGAE